MSNNGLVQLDVEYVDKVLKPGILLPQADLADFFATRTITDDIDQLWVENYMKNKNRIKPFPPNHLGLGKATILVGASSGLNKNWESLLDIDQRFILICSPTTLRFLRERGVRIDFVFALEGRHHYLSDIDCDTSDLTLIASPFVYPEIVKNWKGNIWFYMAGGCTKYQSVLEKDWRDIVPIEPVGGNSISTAFLWAYKFLTSRSFVFCGLSFCFYDNYYFDGRPQPVEDLGRWKEFTFLDGRRNVVRTTPTLFGYKMWLEMATQKAPNAEFVNSSEEGIFGVWPEPVEMRGTEVWGRMRFLPWINVAPLSVTIKAYKEKFGGKNNGSRERL